MKSYKRRTLQQHNTCKSWQFPHSYHLWCWRDVSKINDLFLDVKYIQVQNVVITSLHQSVKSRAVVLFCTLKERQHNSVIWQFDKVADFSTASLVMESLVEGCSGKLEDKCFWGVKLWEYSVRIWQKITEIWKRCWKTHSQTMQHNEVMFSHCWLSWF